MIFSELYGAYYNAVAAILAASVDHPLAKGELRKIVEHLAFGESVSNIEAAMTGRWALLYKDGTTPLLNAPTMPLTTLEKRWLNAVSADPRIRLFTDDPMTFPDVEPLFRPEDVRVFDSYADGDPYTDEGYIRTFRMILDAIRGGTPLFVCSASPRGKVLNRVVMPERLEYSEKDDKFRLIARANRYGVTINLARILKCAPYTKPWEPAETGQQPDRRRTVTFELTDDRNALERVLLHFAHFEKQAEKLDDIHARVTLAYDADDETEVLIRLLSFGPNVRVVAPDSFVELVKNRLRKQKNCGR